MNIPYRLENGVGNIPDAEKYMANWDWLTTILGGNFLANGGMELWNGGTSFTNPADGTALMDNWLMHKQSTAGPTTNPEVDIARSADEQSGTYAVAASITTAGLSDESIGIKQYIDISNLGGQTIVFGAFVKTNHTGRVRLKASYTTNLSSAIASSNFAVGNNEYQLLQITATLAAGQSNLTVGITHEPPLSTAGVPLIADSAYVYVIPSLMSAEAKAALRIGGAYLDAKLPVTGGEISGDLSITGNLDVPSINGSGVWGFRNRIINGDMRIDQRNVGATAVTASAVGAYSLDRFISGKNNSTSDFNTKQETASPPTGFTHYLRNTVATADADIIASEIAYTAQVVEGTNVRDFLWGTANAKTVIVSFWVRSSLTGTFSGSIRNSGSGRSYVFTYAISAANTWEKKTITVTGDTTGTWLTTTGQGLNLLFDMGSGPNLKGTAGTWAASNYLGSTGSVNLIGTLGATWDITGVQLELGSVATEFEFRPEAVELQLCQRYYYKLKVSTAGPRVFPGYVFNSTLAIGLAFFPVRMRIAPTALETSGTATDYEVRHAATTTACSAVPTHNASTVDSAGMSFTVASGLTAGQGCATGGATTNAYWAWSAEL